MLGIRLAEPGEFSRRSLMNDKLDLLQTEGLADLINSETDSYIMNQKGYNTPISTPSPSYNSFGSLTNQLFL